MSKRAEIAALGAYPYEGGMKGLVCEQSRPIFIKGYEQAEQDLALTWEDVMFISQTVTKIPYTSGLKEVCEKVLKRFNEQRKK